MTIAFDAIDTDEARHELRVLDPSGDTKLVWDPTRPEEVENARHSFNTLRGKGYMAYRVEREGNKGAVLREFDPAVKTMILAPPTVGG